MEMHLRSSVENPQDKNKSMKGPGVTIPWYMGKDFASYSIDTCSIVFIAALLTVAR